MADIKIAMAGAGNMIEAHIKAFQANAGTKIVGITNRTRSKAEALAQTYNIDQVVDNVEDIVSKTGADLVVMAVYEPAILETVTKLMTQDCAILMEKPMGLELQQARQITKMAEQRSKAVFVGLNRRTMGATMAALNDLNSRDESRFIHVQDQQSLSLAKKIGHVDNVVDNWMFANSVHLVDYITTFGRGEVVDVTVMEAWTSQSPERVVAHIKFSSGDTALYTALWNGPGPWSCTISTASKRWEMRPLESASFQNAGERDLHSVETSAYDKTYKPGFYQQAKAVLEALKSDKDTMAVSAQTALKTVELLAKIYGISDSPR